jgi:arginase family enzyme
LKDERIKALELCEINPLLDNKNRMAEISLVILEDIIHIINKE